MVHQEDGNHGRNGKIPPTTFGLACGLAHLGWRCAMRRQPCCLDSLFPSWTDRIYPRSQQLAPATVTAVVNPTPSFPFSQPTRHPSTTHPPLFHRPSTPFLPMARPIHPSIHPSSTPPNPRPIVPAHGSRPRLRVNPVRGHGLHPAYHGIYRHRSAPAGPSRHRTQTDALEPVRASERGPATQGSSPAVTVQPNPPSPSARDGDADDDGDATAWRGLMPGWLVPASERGGAESRWVEWLAPQRRRPEQQRTRTTTRLAWPAVTNRRHDTPSLCRRRCRHRCRPFEPSTAPHRTGRGDPIIEPYNAQRGTTGPHRPARYTVLYRTL
jgi:hypothetical protein